MQNIKLYYGIKCKFGSENNKKVCEYFVQGIDRVYIDFIYEY